MRENALSAKMAKRVRERGGWMRKVAGGPYGAGWPDNVGVYRGVMLAIEVKLPGKEKTLTELQAQTLKDLRNAGAVALMLTSVRQVDHVLDCVDQASRWGFGYRSSTQTVERLAIQAKLRCEHRARA
jgi:Holliday junction resolvase